MSHRFVKFLGVGGLNTLFGFAVYALFALTELSTFMVLLVSNIAGITFNFFTTGGFVFRDLGLARVPRFLISYGAIFVINLKLLEWLAPLYGGRIWAMAIIVLPMALLSYFIQAWFVFGDKLSSIRNIVHQHLPLLLTAKPTIVRRELVIILLVSAILAAAFCNFQRVTSLFHYLDMTFLIETLTSIKEIIKSFRSEG